jgi:hypothetical protein
MYEILGSVAMGDIKYLELFKSESDKAQAFDEIAARFYEVNFGLSTKSDIDLLMFKLYFDKLNAENKNADGSTNYRACSDYIISKALGISQDRVRNLKLKKQLIYPEVIEWQTALAPLVKTARYDEHTRKIMINIPDVNLYYEIQNYIEEQGGYTETQLNKKLLAIRVEYFIELALSSESEANRKNIVKQLKQNIKSSNKDESKFDDKHIGKSLLDASVNITTVLSNISSLVSPANLLLHGIAEVMTP